MPALYIISLIWLAAGFMTGLTAFGGNLVSVPIIMCIVDPADAIFQGYAAGVSMSLCLSLLYFRFILWREIAIFALASLAGMPFGILYYRHIPVKYIFLLAGLVLLAFIIWQYLQTRLKRPETIIGGRWAIPLGLFSGFLNAAIGMGGPPMAVYAFMRHWKPQEALASLSCIALFTMAIVVPVQFAGAAITADITRHSLASALCGGAGILLSRPVASRLNAAIFRRLLLAMIAFSAVMLLARFAASAG